MINKNIPKKILPYLIVYIPLMRMSLLYTHNEDVVIQQVENTFIDDNQDISLIPHRNTHKVENTVDDIDKRTRKIHKKIKNLDKQLNKIDNISHKEDKIEEKVCAIESTLDEFIDDTTNTSNQITNTTHTTHNKTCNTLQKVCTIVDDVKGIHKKLNSVGNDISNINSRSKRTRDRVKELITINEFIEDKVCTTESTLDEVAQEILPDLDELISTTDSILDKSCDILNIAESIYKRVNNFIDNKLSTYDPIYYKLNILDTDLDYLQRAADSILYKSCQIFTINDKIDSKIDIVEAGLSIYDQSICSKLNELYTALDNLQTIEDSILDKNCQILTAIDTAKSFVNEIKTTANSISDKVCTIFNLANTASNIIDTNLSKTESIFDKTCDILSIVKDIDSNLDEIQSTGDSIFDKACDILSITDNIDSESDCILGILCDIPITQADIPLTITTPGVYCVKEDLTTTTTAITINTSNVVLDLQGHTITGSVIPTGSKIPAVLVGSTTSNVIVQNGAVTNFDFGVAIEGAVTQEIEINNIISYRNRIGFAIEDGTVGIFFTQCIAYRNSQAGFGSENDLSNRNFKFTDCIADFNGNSSNAITEISAGFLLGSSLNIEFDNCTAKGNIGRGFQIGGLDIEAQAATPSEVILKNCIATSNTTEGFFLNSPEFEVQDCISNSNGSHGYEVSSSADRIYHFLRNVAADNEGDGFFIGNTGSLGGYLISNIAHGNTDTGFDNLIGSGSTINRYYNSAAKDNGTDYAGIPAVDPLEMTITSSTSYWTNIEIT